MTKKQLIFVSVLLAIQLSLVIYIGEWLLCLAWGAIAIYMVYGHREIKKIKKITKKLQKDCE